MLLNLHLKDFVIVEDLTLEVGPGFTVLTGETGAGKSILIDALQLILGSRGDASVVREGAARAQLTAEFDLTPTVRTWLEVNALESEDERLLLRRTVDASGRSKAWVNGIAVPLMQLRDLGELLVDIHGQHAHQSLLRPAFQLKLLDDYAHCEMELEQTSLTYQAWRDADDLLAEATGQAERMAERAERLRWMLEDLEALSPRKGEWDELNAEHTRLAHGYAIAEGLNEAALLLTDGDDSASERLSSAYARISSLLRYDPELSGIGESLESAMAILDDAARDVEHRLSRTEADFGRFEKIDRRVTKYFELARKFRTEPEDLFALWESAQEELKSLEAAKDVEALRARRDEAWEAYRKAAEALSIVRRKAAKSLSEAVTDEMQRLTMKGGRLEVALQPAEAGSRGMESALFLIAGHVGVEARPLQKVASGGELARISLAIAVVTAQYAPVDTLIFDEVDSGIGGATAEVVGRLLQQLGRTRQVLCVTHLPQVAACGSAHWRVEKLQEEGRTRSTLRILSREDRVQEIARMLSGLQISQKTLAAAQEMMMKSEDSAQ